MHLDLLAVASSESFTIIGVVLAVALGLTGAIVAVIRLPSDRSTASLNQAQGANEALYQTLEAVERERDYWKARHATCHKRANDLAAELHKLKNPTSEDS